MERTTMAKANRTAPSVVIVQAVTRTPSEGEAIKPMVDGAGLLACTSQLGCNGCKLPFSS